VSGFFLSLLQTLTLTKKINGEYNFFGNEKGKVFFLSVRLLPKEKNVLFLFIS
jgi:hypothetical protein